MANGGSSKIGDATMAVFGAGSMMALEVVEGLAANIIERGFKGSADEFWAQRGKGKLFLGLQTAGLGVLRWLVADKGDKGEALGELGAILVRSARQRAKAKGLPMNHERVRLAEEVGGKLPQYLGSELTDATAGARVTVTTDVAGTKLAHNITCDNGLGGSTAKLVDVIKDGTTFAPCCEGKKKEGPAEEKKEEKAPLDLTPTIDFISGLTAAVNARRQERKEKVQAAKSRFRGFFKKEGA